MLASGVWEEEEVGRGDFEERNFAVAWEMIDYCGGGGWESVVVWYLSTLKKNIVLWDHTKTQRLTEEMEFLNTFS